MLPFATYAPLTQYGWRSDPRPVALASRSNETDPAPCRRCLSAMIRHHRVLALTFTPLLGQSARKPRYCKRCGLFLLTTNASASLRKELGTLIAVAWPADLEVPPSPTWHYSLSPMATSRQQCYAAARLPAEAPLQLVHVH